MTKNSSVCSNISLFSDIYRLSFCRQYSCTKKDQIITNASLSYDEALAVISSISAILKNAFWMIEKREQSNAPREITHLTPINDRDLEFC